MERAVAGAEREEREGASGKWVAHWKMVHIVRPVWERVGKANQLGRSFPPLSARRLTQMVCFFSSRARRFAGRVICSVLPCSTATPGQGMQAAALKAADFFANDDVLY